MRAFWDNKKSLNKGGRNSESKNKNNGFYGTGAGCVRAADRKSAAEPCASGRRNVYCRKSQVSLFKDRENLEQWNYVS